MNATHNGMPTLDEFRSARMTFRTGEKFNPPGLTNFYGCLQAAPDVLGLQHLTFPPFSQGDVLIGLLTINGTCTHTGGVPVTHVWRPDRIERSAEVDGFRLKSVTVMGVREQSATVALEVHNPASTRRRAKLRIRTGGGAIQSVDGWKTPYSPKEGPAISVTPWEGTPPPETLVQNERTVLADGSGVLYASRTSRAVSLQATAPAPHAMSRCWFDYDVEIEPGGTFTLHFGVFLGESGDEVATDYAGWRANPAEAIAKATADWQAEVEAVFTPGNERYSGHLPLLETSDADLRRIYLISVMGVVYHKRIHPRSAYGRTYVTILPRYWVTSSFINDWAFSAWVLAMLDPDCLRKQVELWLTRDIYAHFGTEYVSGTSSGNWYSCNDYSMVRLIATYLRVTGDFAWLETKHAGKTVHEHLAAMARHYRELDQGHGVADYGDRNSLLEAVGSYTHEVASVNAANVWILRELADLHQHLGDRDGATAKRKEAADFVPRVQELYVRGNAKETGGYWHCRQPDGEMVPCRHIWDVIHTLNFMSDDMPVEQVDEILGFFERELLHESWAAALSPLDEDASFSFRLDHQWNGSWPGWVAFATRALFKTGRHEMLRAWLPGIARSANQGPYAQAHFVETYADEIEGGALKGPTEWPYINDWAVVCVGGFFELVLLDLFGVDPGFGALDVKPSRYLRAGDALRNVPWRGGTYDVSADGTVTGREAP